ncbi:hypothetical protein NMY22_g15288 [Coprinellus aureogranulatus]|nr:hypothetical protein NMY22_g15288 [Coprinellus aureogranulatus]
MELDPVDHHRLFDGTFRTSVQDSGGSTALLGYEDVAMPPRGLTLFEEVSLDIQLERPDLGLPDAFNRVSMRQFAEELKESDPSITDDPDKYLHLLKKAVDHDQALLDSYHYPSIRQCPVIGEALPPRLKPRDESKARYVALNDKLCGEFEWYQRMKEGVRDEGGVAMSLDEWVDQDMHPRNREQPKLWT